MKIFLLSVCVCVKNKNRFLMNFLPQYICIDIVKYVCKYICCININTFMYQEYFFSVLYLHCDSFISLINFKSLRISHFFFHFFTAHWV